VSACFLAPVLNEWISFLAMGHCVAGCGLHTKLNARGMNENAVLSKIGPPLQNKRGIEKAPFQLPHFIADTGVMEMRQALQVRRPRLLHILVLFPPLPTFLYEDLL
jgi:hypothetical protein